MRKLKSLFVATLTWAVSSQKLGIHLIRVAILIIFVWIGGLKFWNYEAEGIVPFVANSPFMSFFYAENAPEYKEYKLKGSRFRPSQTPVARDQPYVCFFPRVRHPDYDYRYPYFSRYLLP